MIRTHAVVATTHASRYLQQLCKHWSHKFEVSFDATHGRIALPFGLAELAATDAALAISLTLNDDADAARSQAVVAEHLNRFAFREGELTFDWTTTSN